MDLLKLIIENIAPILTAITGLVGAYGAWRGIKHYKGKKDSDTIGIKPQIDVKNLKKQIAMYELRIGLENELKRIEENPRVKRVCLLKAHNHGGDMDLNSLKYISMEVEKVNGCQSIKNDWQYRPLPNGYTEDVLKPLLIHNEIILKTPDLKTDDLRTVYKSDEVKQSWVFLIHATHGEHGLSEIFYLSIGLDDMEGRSHEFKKLIASVVSNVYSLYQNNLKLKEEVA